jgi:hypothetical protein
MVHLCLLTGAANTYTGCLNSMPTNRPTVGYSSATGALAVNNYAAPNVCPARCPRDGQNCDCRVSQERNITANLYNSVG